MRLTIALVSCFVLATSSGCSIFLPEKGDEGEPCLGNGVCKGSLQCILGTCRSGNFDGLDGSISEDGQDSVLEDNDAGVDLGQDSVLFEAEWMDTVDTGQDLGNLDEEGMANGDNSGQDLVSLDEEGIANGEEGQDTGMDCDNPTSIFEPKVDYPTGDGCPSVKVGDFNEDGILDLVVVSNSPSKAGILLGHGSSGKGDGSFAGAVDYMAGDALWSVTTGDFDEDGIVDLATAGAGGCNCISVLKGNGTGGIGNGTFGDGANNPVGSGPVSVVTGDFNADDHLDLAAANNGSNCANILLGNGDGSFQTKNDYPSGNQPWSITAADFNADGILDLALANILDDSVSVLLGNGSAGKGDGTFTAKQDYATGNESVSVAAGDFNGDGILDLAVAGAASNTISVLLGNGDGTFQPKNDNSTGLRPIFVITGDVNGDEILDLVVANNHGGTISVLTGNGTAHLGDGTFAQKIDYSAGSYPNSVDIGDFNSDGLPDLAVANQDSDNVSILLGKRICN